ncbi:MAG TPA: MFS transporter [Anaerolineales bacterium]|nr:MFS transporter [Anaerolineales bacterium]
MEASTSRRINRLHYAWIVLVMGTLVVFGSLGLARFGYTVILPSMQVSLSLDNTQAGFLATTNLVGYLTLSILGGALASRFGPRKVITIGLALAGAGMLLTGFSKTFLSAALWRGLTGIGSGASNVPAMGLMSAWFVSRRRGFASGIAVAGSSIALVLVGIFVPRLLLSDAETGWRTAWWGFAAITILLAVAGWLLLRDKPQDIGLHPLGLKPEEQLPSSQARTMQWGRIYRSFAVWHLGFVYVAFGFSYIIYLTFFHKRLIAEAGYTQGGAGALFMTMGWFSLFCGLIWGVVSDLLGRKQALFLVYLIHAISFSLFGLWDNPLGFLLSAILFGLTAWSIPAIMAATCGDILGPQLAPAALGFITLFFGIGQAIGPSVAGAMADASGTFVPAYLLAGGVALLGALGTLLLRPASTLPVEPDHT